MKKALLIFALIFSLSLVWSGGLASAIFEEAKSEACKGIAIDASDNPSCDNSGTGELNRVLKLGLDLLSIVVGVITVIMIIISGIKYVTSQGESANVNSAKNTLLYAIIGLIVVALAQFIVQFVLDKAASSPSEKVNYRSITLPLEQSKSDMV